MIVSSEMWAVSVAMASTSSLWDLERKTALNLSSAVGDIASEDDFQATIKLIRRNGSERRITRSVEEVSYNLHILCIICCEMR